MQEQIFYLTIEHEMKKVSTSVVREWLKGVLEGKVDRYIGMVVDNFGTTSSGQVIECSLRIMHREDIPAKIMKNYLADTPDTFRITAIKEHHSTAIRPAD